MKTQQDFSNVHEQWWERLRARTIVERAADELLIECVTRALNRCKVAVVCADRAEAEELFDRAREHLDNVYIFGSTPEEVLERISFVIAKEGQD